MCGKHAYTARAFDQNPVARLERLQPIQGVPSGDSSVGERRAFVIRQVLGQADQPGLVIHAVLLESPVDDAAQASLHIGCRADRARLVARVEESGHPVALLPLGDLGSHLDDLAGAVGPAHNRGTDGEHIGALECNMVNGLIRSSGRSLFRSIPQES